MINKILRRMALSMALSYPMLSGYSLSSKDIRNIMIELGLV